MTPSGKKTLICRLMRPLSFVIMIMADITSGSIAIDPLIMTLRKYDPRPPWIFVHIKLRPKKKRNMIFILKETWSRKWIEKLSTLQQQWWSLTLGGHRLTHSIDRCCFCRCSDRKRFLHVCGRRGSTLLALDWLFNSLPEEALLRASDRQRRCNICSLFNLGSHSIFSFYFE